MNKITQYIADAFTSKLFGGNQAAVCVLDQQIPDELMQKIAIENNFSETAFAKNCGDHYSLRWFTPKAEIDLCGHATLATAFVIMSFVDRQLDLLEFDTKSGRLTVVRSSDGFTMDFPIAEYHKIPVSDKMTEAIGIRPLEAYLGRDLMMVVDSAEVVENYIPDFDKLSALPGLLQCITAEGKDGYDCVSRMFAPKLGVSEDPVTGSSHCMIAPYWGKILNKKIIRACQASKRGGSMLCDIPGNGRINLTGECVLFSRGELYIQ